MFPDSRQACAIPPRLCLLPGSTLRATRARPSFVCWLSGPTFRASMHHQEQATTLKTNKKSPSCCFHESTRGLLQMPVLGSHSEDILLVLSLHRDVVSKT
eukprot:5272527-Amphidinium_carterae.2